MVKTAIPRPDAQTHGELVLLGKAGLFVAALLVSAGCGQAIDAPALEEIRRLNLQADAPLNASGSAASRAGETAPPSESAGRAFPEPPPIVIAPPARFVPAMPPELAEGAGIIESHAWALALGKALFWDQQAGSDGQACASCHFNAGADVRIQNQLNPGFDDVTTGPAGDVVFGSNRSDTGTHAPGQMPGGGAARANATLAASDFPLHQLTDELDRDSAVRTDTNDVVGSMGAFAAEFSEIDDDGRELCGAVEADIFHVYVGGRHAAVRQVEPRNTPSTINAVFNIRQFWDGRANNLFNGVGVFGLREVVADPDQRLIVLGGRAGSSSLDSFSSRTRAWPRRQWGRRSAPSKCRAAAARLPTSAASCCGSLRWRSSRCRPATVCSARSHTRTGQGWMPVTTMRR